jgi:hypothetical protein
VRLEVNKFLLFQKLISKVTALIIFSFVICSSLHAMKNNNSFIGEVWDYNDTSHTARYFCPNTIFVHDDDSEWSTWRSNLVYAVGGTVLGIILERSLWKWAYENCCMPCASGIKTCFTSCMQSIANSNFVREWRATSAMNQVPD